VPPDIITSETSSDVTERENTNATLKCRAKGYPTPKIQWRREDNKPIEYGDWQEKKAKGIIPRKYKLIRSKNVNKREIPSHI
jgi:lachesin, putative (fragment)